MPMPPYDDAGFRLQVASSVDSDDVFVELVFDRTIVAELVSGPSSGSTKLTLLGPPNGGTWGFDATAFRATLERPERRASVLRRLEPPGGAADRSF
jgi:hypothetical protein